MLAGVFPPIAADLLILLSVALGIIALIGAAWVISQQRQIHEDVQKIAGLEMAVHKLQKEVEALQHQVQPPKAAAPAPAPAPQAPGGTPLSQPMRAQQPWAAMLQDYNSLAASMKAPRAEEACTAFVAKYHIQLLTTTEHKVQGTDGKLVPQFVLAVTLNDSTYWGWVLPGQPEKAVVVPNPLHGYDQQLQEEGGMKETFASNYETGSYTELTVKLPAEFRIADKTWLIQQPGVLRVNGTK